MRLLGGLASLLVPLLVLLIARDVYASVMPPIRIPVTHRQYLELFVGHPGKRLMLRMRWDQNISYLYDSPKSYSNTFETPMFGPSSELFYLSRDIPPIRLPVIYGQEDPAAVRDDTNDGVTFVGTFALGPSSAVWEYWTSRSASKGTLSLGYDDNLDALEGGDEVHSYDPLFSALLSDVTSKEFNYSIPLAFDLAQEFTLVPLAIFSNISEIVSLGDRIAVSIEDNCTEHPFGTQHGEITAWLSRSSSVILNGFGTTRESVIGIAEIVGSDASVVTVGRIHTMGSFVHFYDYVVKLHRIRQVFDTFPAAPSTQSPSAFLSALALFVWAMWRLFTWPSVYQWLRFGLSPHQRFLVRYINRSKGHITEDSPAEASIISDNPTAAASVAKPIADSIHAFSYVKSTVATEIFSKGPVDWVIIQCLLSIARITTVAGIYASVWGYRSSRFAAHLAGLAGVPHNIGEVFYWSIIAFVGGVALLVNPYFIRRYTHAGISIVTIALAMLVWICQLPDTTATIASITVNVVYSGITLIIAWEWPFSCLIRGSDARISELLHNANEFEDAESYSNALKRLTVMPELPTASVSKRVTGGSYGYDGSEAVLITLWVAVLLPFVTGWFVVINLLAVLEQLPANTARLYAVILLGVAAAIGFSWYRTYGKFLQQMQESTRELQSALYKRVKRE